MNQSQVLPPSAVEEFDAEDARIFAESLARPRHRVGATGIQWGRNGCPMPLVGCMERLDGTLIGLSSLVDLMAAEEEAMHAGQGFLMAHALYGVSTAAQVLSRDACNLIYSVDSYFRSAMQSRA